MATSQFRFSLRWPEILSRARDRLDEALLEQVIDMLEQRDRDEETWLNRTGILSAQLTTPTLNDYLVFDGTQWINTNGDWTTYAPTWSGTIGNGTVSGAYHRIGRTIHYRIGVLWGTTTTHAAAAQTFTLPVAAHADWDQHAPVGDGGAKDASAGPLTTYGWANIVSAPSTIVVTNANLSSGVWTNLLPMTWATGDIARIRGMYQAAS